MQDKDQDQEYEYGEIDRKKVAFLIGGILVIVTAILLAVWLSAGRTKASTGSGEAPVVTPDHIAQITEDVSKQVLDTLCQDILADMVRQSIEDGLTADKIYQILSEGDIEYTLPEQEELQTMILDLLSSLEISGDGVLSKEQKEYIKLVVEKALQEYLKGADLSQLFTDEEKRRLKEQLQQELSDLIKEQIQSSTYRLSDQDLAKIKDSLQLDKLIQSTVKSVTKDQLAKLKESIIKSMKKSIKTPVKGVDYFTEKEIRSIQGQVLDKANLEMQKQLEELIERFQKGQAEQDGALENAVKGMQSSLDKNGSELDKAKAEFERDLDDLKEEQKKEREEQKKEQEEEQKKRKEADDDLQSQIDQTGDLIGDITDAEKAEGKTVFQKIGAILKILSSDGLEGLRNALRRIGNADTLEEGIGNFQADLTATKARVTELEKERWHADITLLAEGAQEDTGYSFQESGSAYVYRIPVVTESDQIDLEGADTSIVVEFKHPDRLPSNVAFSAVGNDLLITFTNKPSRNIKIVSIHVYKEK